jgi:hypothetical protein
MRSIVLANGTNRKMKYDSKQTKRYDCFVELRTAVLNAPLVVTQFIETMKFLLKNGNQKQYLGGRWLLLRGWAVEGKIDNFDPVPDFRRKIWTSATRTHNSHVCILR